jgi:hypothetical protein
LFLLVGPGTLAGFSMLLAHAGIALPLQLPQPATHAKIQLVGFFLVLIWGFLVHGLSGMLGADTKHTKRVNPWLAITSIILFALWIAESLGAGHDILRYLNGALLVAITAGSTILVVAGLRGTHRWSEPPFPMLMIPLAVPPPAALLWYLDTPALNAAAGQFMLWGCITPIILAMGYRMFSSMVRMRFPHERIFSQASLIWGGGVVLLAASTAGAPLSSLWGRIAIAAASLGFLIALRVFEPVRTPDGKAKHVAVDASLRRHIRVGSFFFLASAAIFALSPTELLPGAPFYWDDAARHFLAIGFCLILVSGITQRLFPSFLRARASSARWMDGTLILFAAGVTLRLAEPFLPEAAPWVAASAILLYAGVLGYALQVALPLLRSGKAAASRVERIRRDQNVERCSPG